MVVVRELLTSVGLKVNQQSMRRAEAGVDGIKRSMMGLNEVMAGFGAFMIGGIVLRGFGKFIKLGSDSEETMNVVNQAFGESKQEILDWAQVVGSTMNRAETDMIEFAAGMGAMLEPMVGNKKEAAKLSMNFGQLAVDLASFYNTQDVDALNALKSAMAGQSLPMRRYGVVLLDSTLKQFALTQGITKTMKQMTQAEKIQLRYRFIMDQTKTAQGDAARTAGSYANATKGLRGALKDLGTDASTVLLPAFAGMAVAARDLVQGLRDVQKNSNTVKFVFMLLKIAMVALGSYISLVLLFMMGKLSLAVIQAVGSMTLLGNSALLAQLKMVALGVVILVLIALLFLLADDIYHFFTGGKSLIADFITWWDKLMTKLATSPIDPNDHWIIQLAKLAAQAWKEWEQQIGNLYDRIALDIDFPLGSKLRQMEGRLLRIVHLFRRMRAWIKGTPELSPFIKQVETAQDTKDRRRRQGRAERRQTARKSSLGIKKISAVGPTGSSAAQRKADAVLDAQLRATPSIRGGQAGTSIVNAPQQSNQINITQRPGESGMDLGKRVTQMVGELWEDELSNAEAASSPSVGGG